jgi:hypothetical protein
MIEHPAGFFQGTEMPTAGWWEALWPMPRELEIHEDGRNAALSLWRSV